MTRDEIKAKSISAELEKLNARRERNIETLEKKAANAEKCGMNITREEWFAIREGVTQDQSAAYLSLSIARGELEDTEHRIATLSKNAEKVRQTVTARTEKISKEEAERAAAEEIKRWANDGIIVKHMTSKFIVGETPKGEFFRIEGNNGFTERSRHCYTLQIGKETVFTSGEFYRAYSIIKKR